MTFDWRPALERYAWMQHESLRFGEADTGTITVVPWNIQRPATAVIPVRPWWLRTVRRQA
jgi:hypothetical protein